MFLIEQKSTPKCRVVWKEHDTLCLSVTDLYRAFVDSVKSYETVLRGSAELWVGFESMYEKYGLMIVGTRDIK